MNPKTSYCKLETSAGGMRPGLSGLVARYFWLVKDSFILVQVPAAAASDLRDERGSLPGPLAAAARRHCQDGRRLGGTARRLRFRPVSGERFERLTCGTPCGA